MPNYGVNFGPIAHQYITQGLEMPKDGSMPNRSERINRLVILGATVEQVFAEENLPHTAEERDTMAMRGDLRQFLGLGIKEARRRGYTR